MATDPRHVVGAILTLTMFVMLGNMIKKDHFDPVEVTTPESTSSQFEGIKVTEKTLVSLPRTSEGPWEKDSQHLKSCWTRPPFKEVDRSKGFISFSLTNGPEYHVSQIADAVAVARYLGATLVIPDIRGSKPGEVRNFQDIYDIEKFLKSLDGVVKVARDLPVKMSPGKVAIARVPNRVTEDYIVENIVPIFKRKGNLRLATYFPSINMRKAEQKTNLDSVTCVAMYGALELQPELHEVVDLMVEHLRTLSRKSGGKFIAVDLRLEILEKKGCQRSDATGRKSCYNPHEIGVFLRKLGFDKDTTIYLTQAKWHSSLDALRDLFPKTYTKEVIMPANKKSKFFNSRSTEMAKALDFYICSQSDVFVPAISGLFYANVAGKRIASGKTQILVPAQISSSASIADFISPYISKKYHLAYSCYC